MDGVNIDIDAGVGDTGATGAVDATGAGVVDAKGVADAGAGACATDADVADAGAGATVGSDLFRKKRNIRKD